MELQPRNPQMDKSIKGGVITWLISDIPKPRTYCGNFQDCGPFYRDLKTNCEPSTCRVTNSWGVKRKYFTPSLFATVC